MFGIYLKRELSRRKKAALVIAMGLALGIALVITVDSVSAGMTRAQDKVLKSLYGLGTDMTVTKARSAPGTGSSQGPNFKFDAKRSGTSTQSSALVKRPKVLLADEPTGNLDEGTRDDVMALLEGLWREHGLTFVMVTHDSSTARRAPRPATIEAGRITLTEQAGVSRDDAWPQPYAEQRFGAHGH
ncbi:hypothetical protein [Streptomyces sp. YKOK-J1]